jgi:hypothetical protein
MACVPNPKHTTKTSTVATQAALTHSHQRLWVSVCLDPDTGLNAAWVAVECFNESNAGGELRDGASRIGFTNGFPKEKAGGHGIVDH